MVRKKYWLGSLLVVLAVEPSNGCGEEPKQFVQEQTDARIEDGSARIAPDVSEADEDASGDAGPTAEADVAHDARADRDREAAADASPEANDAPEIGPVHEPVIGCAAASLPGGASFEI